MIKILKLASYLSIALAISTVVFAGIGITRENSTFSERAEFLDTPTVVEIFREQKDNLPKTDNDKTSPLVVQASKFADRINPPKPPEPTKNTDTSTARTGSTGRSGPKLPPPPPPPPTSSKLIATCRYEKFPEKSLALLDVTSEGNKWLREGDKLGYKTIHRIEDGKIVLRQGNQETVLYVPKDNTIKSLLKGSGDNVMATVSPTTGSGATARPTSTTGRTTSRTVTGRTGRTTGYSPTYRTGRTVRRRPAQPTTEEARKAAERNTAEIKGILDGMSTKKNEGSKVDSKTELMQAVMKMLEAGSKKKAPPAKAPPGKAPAKKGSSK